MFAAKEVTVASARFKAIQITDLHIMDKSSGLWGKAFQILGKNWDSPEICLSKTTELIRTICESQRPSIAVLTGDIIDGRGKTSVDEFTKPMSILAETFDKLHLPWIYLPGNHEGDCETVSRQELLTAIRQLPQCAIPDTATSFDYGVRVKTADDNNTAELIVLDCPQRTIPYSLTPNAVTAAQQWATTEDLQLPKLLFTHEPIHLVNSPDCHLLTGHQHAYDRGIEDVADHGFGEWALKYGDTLFCGHDHHSDCAKQIPGHELVFGYGRHGSFFPPSEHEGKLPLPFTRGARLFEVDGPCVSTYTIDENGEQSNVAKNDVIVSVK